jgi:hypothetical protein
MNKLTLLLVNQSQSTLTLPVPLSKQPALREIPFTTSIGLQKEMKNIKSYKTTQILPNHLPQGFGTYPNTMTPCIHIYTPSTN